MQPGAALHGREPRAVPPNSPNASKARKEGERGKEGEGEGEETHKTLVEGVDERLKAKIRAIAKECRRLREVVHALEESNAQKDAEGRQLSATLQAHQAARHHVEGLLKIPADASLNNPTVVVDHLRSLKEQLEGATAKGARHTQALEQVAADKLAVRQHAAELAARRRAVEKAVGLPNGCAEDADGRDAVVEAVRKLRQERERLLQANHKLLKHNAQMLEQRSVLEESMERMVGEVEGLDEDEDEDKGSRRGSVQSLQPPQQPKGSGGGGGGHKRSRSSLFGLVRSRVQE